MKNGFPATLALAASVPLLFTAALGGCGSSVQAPDAAPVIEGEIVAVGDEVTFPEPDPSTLTLVWIKEEPTDQDECGVVFFVEPTTDILVGSEEGSVDDLRTGRRARGWTPDGAVAESCPAQGKALAIQVLGA